PPPPSRQHHHPRRTLPRLRRRPRLLHHPDPHDRPVPRLPPARQALRASRQPRLRPASDPLAAADGRRHHQHRQPGLRAAPLSLPFRRPLLLSSFPPPGRERPRPRRPDTPRGPPPRSHRPPGPALPPPL